MAPRSKKIRAPSDYFLWAPQEQGAQSENPRFSSERHSRRGACRLFDTLRAENKFPAPFCHFTESSSAFLIYGVLPQ